MAAWEIQANVAESLARMFSSEIDAEETSPTAMVVCPNCLAERPAEAAGEVSRQSRRRLR
jgi:hypothetical protein